MGIFDEFSVDVQKVTIGFFVILLRIQSQKVRRMHLNVHQCIDVGCQMCVAEMDDMMQFGNPCRFVDVKRVFPAGCCHVVEDDHAAAIGCCIRDDLLQNALTVDRTVAGDFIRMNIQVVSVNECIVIACQGDDMTVDCEPRFGFLVHEHTVKSVTVASGEHMQVQMQECILFRNMIGNVHGCSPLWD